MVRNSFDVRQKVRVTDHFQAEVCANLAIPLPDSEVTGPSLRGTNAHMSCVLGKSCEHSRRASCAAVPVGSDWRRERAERGAGRCPPARESAKRHLQALAVRLGAAQGLHSEADAE